VKKSAGSDEALAQARATRGTLIASGFIAGGALLGVVAAGLKIVNVWTGAWTGIGALAVLPQGLANLVGASPEHTAEVLGLLAYCGLCAYMLWDARRGEKES
jgi:hypothetical protein